MPIDGSYNEQYYGICSQWKRCKSGMLFTCASEFTNVKVAYIAGMPNTCVHVQQALVLSYINIMDITVCAQAPIHHKH